MSCDIQPGKYVGHGLKGNNTCWRWLCHLWLDAGSRMRDAGKNAGQKFGRRFALYHTWSYFGWCQGIWNMRHGWPSSAGKSTSSTHFSLSACSIPTCKLLLLWIFLLNVIFRGKGLGKNEDGIVEHVKVQKKEDNAGVSSQNATFKFHFIFSLAFDALSEPTSLDWMLCRVQEFSVVGQCI